MAGKKKQIKHSRRYEESDIRIIASLRKQKKAYRARVTVRQVIDGAGLKRSSFYYHYSDVNAAVEASENNILDSFLAFLENPPIRYRKKRGNPNRALFELMLLFMRRHKEIFREICDDINNQSVLYKMVEYVYPHLVIIWYPINQPAPVIGSERAEMLFRLIAEVITRWGKETHCDFKKADYYIDKLVKITNEASIRCK